MNRLSLLTLFSTVLLLLSGSLARSQGVPVVVDLVIAPGDSAVTLPHPFVVGEIILTATDDTAATTLRDSIDFVHDRNANTIVINESRRTFDTLRLRASYRHLPLSIPRTYTRYEIVDISDSTGAGQVVRSDQTGEITATDIFGADFRRSGSITRGVTVGSNRDLTVQSGLRLQFSGRIADSVEVLGALTDEQTPIQPEGNTQTIREVDNIFFEVRSPVADGTLGKFTAAGVDALGAESSFTAFGRKFQGIKALGKFKEAGATQLVAAISPGTFRTQEFLGREGDQGPYRLTGESGEREILVQAGTEHVYVDGVEQTRGRDYDYVIDYGTGEITFQPRRPITGVSEIVVDFEYTNRRYSRSFIAASHAGRFIDSTLSLTARYVREGDNQDAPIDLTLSEQDRLLLAAAGADLTGAARTGATIVGRSDTLSGTYRRVDTMINGQSESIFIYDPSSPEAIYAVTFSRAPDGRGDYRSVAFGRYDFVGKGAGDYLPVIFLPLPELYQIGALALGVRPSQRSSLQGEIAYSSRNRNRFSSDAATTLDGIGIRGEGRVSSDSLRIAGMNLGTAEAVARINYLDAGFTPVSRISEAEFGRRWDAGARLGESGFDDLMGEGSLRWRPLPTLELLGGVGHLRRGDFLTSTRQEYHARYAGPRTPLAADATAEIIDSRDTIAGGRTGDWTKLRGGMKYRLGRFTPGVRADFQEREDRRIGADTLLPGAFRYLEVGPDLLIDHPFIRTELGARYRWDDSARFDPATGDTRYVADGSATTLSLRGDLRGVKALRSSLDFTYRHKRYDSVPGVDPLSRLDNVSILARSESRWSPFNGGVELEAVYDVQTERAARTQRLFVQVPVGQGEYIWRDIDSNGVQTEEEFRETIADEGEYVRIDLPTEQLFPVVDLAADVRLRIRPETLLDDSTAIGRLLRPFSSETTLRISEKNSGEDETPIYLLDFSRFQNDSTTIAGAGTIEQTLHLFERSRAFNARLRFTSRTGLTRYFDAVERSRAIERTLRLEWNPTIDIGLMADLAVEDRSLLGGALTATRAYDLEALRGETDFSYRPARSVELGWIFRIRSVDDVFPTVPRTTFLTGNEIRGVYSIETKGRLTASLERTVVEGENLAGGDIFTLPFQLTDGYAIGTTWIGRLGVDYRFGANIQASLTYTGRAEPPSNRVVHIGRMEFRAFF